MRIFVTGATGLVGRRLVRDRLDRGDAVVALTRDATRGRARLPEGAEVVEGDPTVPGPWQAAVDGCDAIVHLAGAGVADRRWTPSYQRLLLTSRIDSGHQVVEAMRAAADPPRVVIAASAVGWYPDGGDAVLREGMAANRGDFFGDLCAAWEGSTAPARDLGARVVPLRIGLVMDPEGGLIARLAPVFRWFVGGPIGFGRAWTPWIHWADIVGLVDHALRTGGLDEAMNAVSPAPVRNGAFSRALGRALGRPSLIPVPTPVLRIVLGKLAKYAVGSQRVVPEVATGSGYAFRHPEIQGAMSSLFTPDAGRVDPAAGPLPPSALTAPPPPPAGPSADARPTVPIQLLAVPLEEGLMDGGRVQAGAAAACRAAAATGCRVVLATGRPPRATREVVSAAGLSSVVITCNGALIWNHAERAAVHHEPLSADLARQVVARVRAASPECLVGIDRIDRWYTDREPDAADGRTVGVPDASGPLESFLDEPVTQLDLLVPAADVAAVRAALEPLGSERLIARYERAGGHFQIVHPRAEKAVALQRIARGAGIDRAAVMAVGGGAHDIGMVEWAGFGVALADAPASVRAIADALTGPRAEGGLARIITRCIVAPDRPAGTVSS